MISWSISPRRTRHGTVAPSRGAVGGLESPQASAPKITMGKFFIPQDPMESIMRLCNDLQQNETPFQISVKIVGSIEFNLSTMPSQKEENVNNQSGGWRHRGPAYLRRQLKRCIERKVKKSQKSGEEDETTRKDTGGVGYGGQPTPTKRTHVSAENAANKVVPQLPNVTNNDVVSEEAEVLDPGDEIIQGEEEEEGGGGGCAAEEKSDRPELVFQMKKIQEEMKIHRQILRGSLALISENTFPIYNEDHGHHHFYEVEEVDSYIKKCRNDFGLPDVTSERRWMRESCDEIPKKISQKLQSCWSPDDICLNCNQRKPRFCIKQIEHDCNLRYDSDSNDFVPK